jgi:hypothetical protein
MNALAVEIIDSASSILTLLESRCVTVVGFDPAEIERATGGANAGRERGGMVSFSFVCSERRTKFNL